MTPFTAADFDAIRDPGRSVHIFPDGWVSDGSFAMRLGDGHPVEGTRRLPGSPAHLRFERVTTAPRLGATERQGWRLPGWNHKAGRKCVPCDGKGEVRCELDELHECRNCRGKGELPGGREAQLGQVVIDVNLGGVICMAGRFAPLVDKTSAVVALRIDAVEDAIGMVDDAGVLIALALPLRCVDPVMPDGLAAAVQP